jgi:hypothetical protein
MHDQGIRFSDGGILLTPPLVARWEAQIATPYADLTQREQASDMEQVDRYWPHIQALVDRMAVAEGSRALAVGLAEIAEARIADVIAEGGREIDGLMLLVGQKDARIAALEAAARAVTTAWPHTNVVDFTRAIDALAALVETPDE